MVVTRNGRYNKEQVEGVLKQHGAKRVATDNANPSPLKKTKRRNNNYSFKVNCIKQYPTDDVYDVVINNVNNIDKVSVDKVHVDTVDDVDHVNNVDNVDSNVNVNEVDDVDNHSSMKSVSPTAAVGTSSMPSSAPTRTLVTNTTTVTANTSAANGSMPSTTDTVSVLTREPWKISPDQETIMQCEKSCCAGAFCTMQEQPLTSHNRCPSCFCSMHGDCGYEVEFRILPTNFARMCFDCVAASNLQHLPPNKDKSIFVKHLDGTDCRVIRALRILHLVPPNLSLVPVHELKDDWHPVKVPILDSKAPNALLPADDTSQNKQPKKKKDPPGPLNLKCTNSIRAHFPKGYVSKENKLQPTDNYRVSVERYKEWLGFSREKQLEEKKRYLQLDERTRAEFNVLIPGDSVAGCSCTGCRGRKPRSDKNIKRRNAEAPTAEYISMGHDQESRTAIINQHQTTTATTTTRRKTGRSKFDVPEHANTIQQQGNETALAKVHDSIAEFLKAATLTTMAPGTISDSSSTPKIHGLMFWVVEVAETPMCGGSLPAPYLRREKPLVFRVGTSKKAAAVVTKYVSDAALKTKNEVVDFFGGGDETMNKLKEYVENRKKARVKLSTLATSTQDASMSAAENAVSRTDDSEE